MHRESPAHGPLAVAAPVPAAGARRTAAGRARDHRFPGGARPPRAAPPVPTAPGDGGHGRAPACNGRQPQGNQTAGNHRATTGNGSNGSNGRRTGGIR